ncbi:UTRA domain-containing protein, partial [Staphylococcus arlettae]
ATKVLKLELIPAIDVPMVKDKLGLALGAKLWHIVRVRTVNGQVKILDEDYLVETMVPKITLDIAQQSLYRYIEEVLGLEI